MVLITTILWLATTFLTKPEDNKVLYRFYKITKPGGPGWNKVHEAAKADGVTLEDENAKWSVPSGVLAMIVGCILVYGCLFATGNWIYGNYPLALGLTVMVLIATFVLIRIWRGMRNVF